MTTRRKLLVLAACLLAGTAGGVTLAAFSSQTSNSGNTFSAAAAFADLQMATGSYTGNGGDNRNITGLGFQPDVVTVKAATNQIGVMTTAVTQGTDSSKPLATALSPGTNRIQDLTADGFQIGNNAQVNGSGVTYYWTAFKANPDVLAYGLYVGNGSSSHTVTGVGFDPEYVIVAGAGATRAVQRIQGMSRTYQFDQNTGSTTQITGFNSDGFVVGSAAEVNSNGQYYAYVAFNEQPGVTDIGTYTGNANSRSITGVGFQPDFVNVRADDTSTGRDGRMRPAALSGTSSQFYDATANATNAITALQSDGFQLGTDVNVNASGRTYWYFAARNTL